MSHESHPPETQPEGLGMVPVSEEEALESVRAANPRGSAWDVAWRFREAATRPYGPDAHSLAMLVTPESLPAWGDFSKVAEVLTGTGMLSGTEEPSPGVAYVRFVADPGYAQVADGDVQVMGRAVATLVFRQEAGEWQVHGLGDYLPPEDLPAGIF